VDAPADFGHAKMNRQIINEGSAEHWGVPARKLSASEDDLQKNAPAPAAPLPTTLKSLHSASSPLSTSPRGGSYASALSQVTVVMVADVGSQASLRAAHCTWLAMLDPAQVVHVTDFEMSLKKAPGGSSSSKGSNRSGKGKGNSSGASPLGGCGFPVKTVLKVKFAIDYYDIMHQLYVSKVRSHTVLGGARKKFSVISLPQWLSGT
jgi:hypothetical protein